MRRLLAVAVAAGAALTGAALSVAAPGAALATATHVQGVHGTPTVHATPAKLIFHGPRMYNPANGQTFTQPSEVIVSQDSQLAPQMVQVNWSNFTPSSPTATAYTNNTVEYPVMITECNRLNPTNPDQCFEATNGGTDVTETAYGASNDAYSVTAANGTGQADISILTGVENQFLGCGPTHPCSLAVVPAQGGNNLVDPADCSQHLYDPQGAAMGQYSFTPLNGTPNSQCAWAKRIIIPLHFAPTAASCPLRAADFAAEGSPMLARAMQQWQAGICKGSKSVEIQYNSSVNEYEARQFYASGVTDVAFTTQPFASGTSTTHPYTYAPVAITATSIAYWLDDTVTQEPYTNLRLNARMVAKLLTTSYAFGNDGCPNNNHVTGCDSGVDGNPSSMFNDPEFTSLNPKINNTFPTSYQIPTIMSGQSDMTWALTSWIAADKNATSFLAGAFDPWGMHVDTYYLGLKYPTDQFVTNDPFIPVALYYSPTFPLSKVAYYQSLNWAPGLQDVKDPITGGYIPLTQEPLGERALFAVLDQPDAAAFLFPVAALQNHAGKYVEPTMLAMSAAVQDMKVNPDGITRSTNLNSKDPREYPLTMVVYAIVPTGGISHTKATKIAQFLDYVAGAGQRSGLLPGELPPGYLPLTPSMRKQTLKAAQEVLDQVGNKPSGPDGGHHSPSSGPSSHSSSPSSSPSSPSAHNSSSPSPEAVHEIAVSFSRPDSTGMSWVVLVLLIVGFVFAISGPTALVYANPKARAKITAIANTDINLRKLKRKIRKRKQP
jgi:hypothetical protein